MNWYNINKIIKSNTLSFKKIFLLHRLKYNTITLSILSSITKNFKKRLDIDIYMCKIQVFIFLQRLSMGRISKHWDSIIKQAEKEFAIHQSVTKQEQNWYIPENNCPCFPLEDQKNSSPHFCKAKAHRRWWPWSESPMLRFFHE